MIIFPSILTTSETKFIFQNRLCFWLLRLSLFIIITPVVKIFNTNEIYIKFHLLFLLHPNAIAINDKTNPGNKGSKETRLKIFNKNITRGPEIMERKANFLSDTPGRKSAKQRGTKIAAPRNAMERNEKLSIVSPMGPAESIQAAIRIIIKRTFSVTPAKNLYLLKISLLRVVEIPRARPAPVPLVTTPFKISVIIRAAFCPYTVTSFCSA